MAFQASASAAAMPRASDAANAQVTRWPVLILSVGFLLLIAVGASTAWLVQDARAQNENVAHTLEVQAEASRLLNSLLDAETGQRGYLLTSGPTYLQRHRLGLAQVSPSFARLHRLTLDNPRQRAALARIAPLAQAKMAELRRTADLTEAGRTSEALAIVRTDVGKRLMEDIRVQIGSVQNEEARLLADRRASAERAATLLLLLVAAGLAIAAALALAAIRSMLGSARSLERANADIAGLNEGLEATVTERTADLQAANDEIQRFAYIVSHDLRSPLVNVMGFTSELDAAGVQARDLLAKATATAPDIVAPDHRLAIEEDMPEALAFIRTSTAKMDRLINAILKLSREGRRNLAPERIDMTRMIEDVAGALRQQTEAAGARIVVEPLPELVSDRLAIDQVFGNLVENAVKYLSEDRPGLIRVTGKVVNEQVEIVVEDNGRGIDSADLERVFDLFRRAGTQDRPGEGIGLAHVRALVRRLGGSIGLSSEPGRGSRFTVSLPRVLKGMTAE